MTAGAHYDKLETRDPAARRRAEGRALTRQVAHAKANSAHYGELLREVDAAAVTTRKALARLPVTRKSELADLQQQRAPLGGLEGVPRERFARVFQSPGPVYEPDGHQHDYWRFARALFAAGFRAGDLVHNSFSYHLTPAGRMVECGAHALGCRVFPGGIGNTELQVAAIAHLRPAAFAGTPSFLRILLHKARDTGADVSSLAKASVGGEAFPPSLRDELKGMGVEALQSYGTADVGLIAYETPAREGLVVDEGALVEIVRPGTGDPVPEGEVGEVLVTPLGNPVYPLLRFATGDLSAVLPGASPCGRTNLRIRGWMGRADQSTKVKGMFVTPGQIAQVLARHPEIGKARLEVSSVANADSMVLKCETAARDASLAPAIAESLQAACKVRGTVELVAPGSLPNDGKVIADLRSYA